MSSLERLLSVLDLYSEVEPIWTLDEIIQQTGYARSTAYRYVRELCDSGLLISIGKGAHVLGPRFIELDRLIRNTDPLLMAAQKIIILQKENDLTMSQPGKQKCAQLISRKSKTLTTRILQPQTKSNIAQMTETFTSALEKTKATILITKPA